MKFDADVARILKNPILRWPVDDWLSWVDLTTHTKVHLHLGEDLKLTSGNALSLCVCLSLEFIVFLITDIIHSPSSRNLVFYLDVFGELVVSEDAERGEIAYRVELENDLDGLAIARVVTPTDPTYATS